MRRPTDVLGQLAGGRNGEEVTDRGSILPMTMMVTVVLSVIVVSIGTYVATGLRYAKVANQRVALDVAAEGGLDYAVEQLAVGGMAPCASTKDAGGFGWEIPIGPNDTSISISCKRLDGPRLGSWGLALTGEGIDESAWLLRANFSPGRRELLHRPVYVADPARIDTSAPLDVVGGDLWYSSYACGESTPSLDTDVDILPASRGLRCTADHWSEIFPTPPLSLPPTDVVDPPPVMEGWCKVFSPGIYTQSPDLGAHNYFRSGDYYFHHADLRVTNATVTAGWSDSSEGGDQQMIENSPCDAAIWDDRHDPAGKGPGATFYLGGSAWVDVDIGGRLEIARRRQGDDFVSIQTIDAPTAGIFDVSTRSAYVEILDSSDENPSELVVHGLVWAPRSMIGIADADDVAFGQLLGGAVASRLILHSSNVRDQVVSRAQPAHEITRYVVEVTAEGDGHETIRAVVDVDPEGATAVESWTVPTGG